jgi:hypothetical protein
MVATRIALLILALLPAGAAAFTPDDGVTDLNALRTSVGETPVTLYAPWNTGCDHANNYTQQTGELTHNEDPSKPGYTADGSDAAGNSVLAGGERLPSAAWLGAPLHRTGILQPRLAVTGYAASHGSTCMRIGNTNSMSQNGEPLAENEALTTPGLTTYPYPPDGATGVRLSGDQRGQEGPDPFTLLPDAITRTGMPLTVEFNGPWTEASFGITRDITAATLAPTGGVAPPVQLAACGSGCDYDLYLGGAILLEPYEQYLPGTKYAAHVTGSVSDFAGDMFPLDLTWTFTTAGTPPRVSIGKGVRHGSKVAFAVRNVSPGYRALVTVGHHSAKTVTFAGQDVITANRPRKHHSVTVRVGLGNVTASRTYKRR